MHNWTADLFLSIAIAVVCSGPACFASSYESNSLNAENIARTSMNVAQATHTSGRCYAAVCRALNPLGVRLTGASAYMAQSQLLQDSRFTPLLVSNVDQLSRGDIIVYQKSGTHPHGHICVYQGEYVEASDHIAKVTHTQAYGGATVFRLRNELLAHPFISQPAYPPPTDATAASYLPGSAPEPMPAAAPSYLPPRHAAIYAAADSMKGRIVRSLTRRALRFLMDSL